MSEPAEMLESSGIIRLRSFDVQLKVAQVLLLAVDFNRSAKWPKRMLANRHTLEPRPAVCRRVVFDKGKATKMHAAGSSIREIADALEVGRATIHRFLLSQKPTEFALRKLLETRGEGWALCLSL
jgi:hypothetical protein